MYGSNELVVKMTGFQHVEKFWHKELMDHCCIFATVLQIGQGMFADGIVNFVAGIDSQLELLVGRHIRQQVFHLAGRFDSQGFHAAVETGSQPVLQVTFISGRGQGIRHRYAPYVCY